MLLTQSQRPDSKNRGSNIARTIHTVDLRLGNEITIPQTGPYAYDFYASGKVADLIAKNSIKRTINQDQPHYLRTGELILAQTLETVKLPIDKGPPECLSHN